VTRGGRIGSLQGRTPWPASQTVEEAYDQPAPRQHAAYACTRGHAFAVPFAAGVIPPGDWACRCGAAATYDGTGPGGATAARPRWPARMDEDPEHVYKLLHQRRGRAELEQLLADRITEIRDRAQP
jgi:uncharacterized protein with gpF-like domain